MIAQKKFSCRIVQHVIVMDTLEEPSASHCLLEILDRCRDVVSRGGILGEQSRRNQVHALIGTLRGKNCSDKQLQWG